MLTLNGKWPEDKLWSVVDSFVMPGVLVLVVGLVAVPDLTEDVCGTSEECLDDDDGLSSDFSCTCVPSCSLAGNGGSGSCCCCC